MTKVDLDEGAMNDVGAILVKFADYADTLRSESDDVTGEGRERNSEEFKQASCLNIDPCKYSFLN